MAGFQRIDRALIEAAREMPPEESREEPSLSETWQTGKPMPTLVRGVPYLRWQTDTLEAFNLSRNPSMQAAYDQVVAVACEKACSALLAGPPGNGKTHLAIGALRHWYLQHDNGGFWKVPDFLDWLRGFYRVEDYDGVSDMIRAYQSFSTLIVFDDLGTENPTDWACEQLYRVLDGRYDNQAPTIITTNQHLNRLDARILSRYRSGLVLCKGDDLRGQPL